jgi:hypothetical protein
MTAQQKAAAEQKAEEQTAEEQKAVEKPVSGGNRVLAPDAQRPPGDIRRRTDRKKRTGPFIKYVGAASHRIIRPYQWATLQIPLKDKEATHTWNVANDKMIEADKFTDEQLDYLLIDDLQSGSNAHAFLAVDYDNDGKLVQVDV